MCLSPINLINPKKNISLYGGLPYRIAVPCGQCADCKKAAQNEWYFRAYYESKYTFDNGGYVYFDTLTYRNEDLPHVSDFFPELKGHISDFSCFNVDHYRYFLVNLRRQLEYYGFDVKHKLKYFLSSEYGTDDRYTHRPHYHILFYVLDNSLSPIQLSQFISKCWKYGRTDGYQYKGAKYVLDHTFGKKYNSDQFHMQTICNYVSKYVTKDSSFQKTVDSRIKIIKDKRSHGDILTDRQEEMIKDLVKNMNQFHRQSHGFGEAFYLYNDMNKVLETGMISIPDKNNIVKHIPLPGYYARKMFYDLTRDFDGHLKWQINELGIKFKLEHKLKSIDLFSQNFKDWHDNMVQHRMSLKEGYTDEDGKVWTKEEVDDWYSEHLDKFDKILGDRSIKDFVIYLLCYKGRIKSEAEVQRELNGIYKVDRLDEFVIKEFAFEQDFGCKQVFNYAHHVYKKRFGKSFVTDKDLGSVQEWKTDGVSQELARWLTYRDEVKNNYGFVPNLLNSYSETTRRYNFGSCISSDTFENRYVINDKSDVMFEGFDEMYWLWCDSLKFDNVEKQKYHDWKEDYKKRMKASGMFKRSV